MLRPNCLELIKARRVTIRRKKALDGPVRSEPADEVLLDDILGVLAPTSPTRAEPRRPRWF
jgi:hypothetical protein